MESTVMGAKLEATNTYIGHVRRNLPKLLREKVGTGHTNWTEFLQAVRDIDLDHIREGVDIWKKEEDAKRKEQEERKKEVENHDVLRRCIQQLEKLTSSPTAPIRQQMTTFSIGDLSPTVQQTAPSPANPFKGSMGGQGNLFYATPSKPQQQNSNPRPPATQVDRAALLVCL